MAMASAVAAVCAALSAGIRTAVSGAGTSAVYRTCKDCWVACLWGCWRACLSALLTVFGICGGGCVSEIADSLDVVAGDRRCGDRAGRFGFPAGAGRGLRHHRRLAAGNRDHARDSRRAAGEMVYLGGLVGFGDVRRRAGAIADDGWGTGRAGSDVSAERGRGVLAADQHGSGFGRHDARRRSRASCLHSN